MASIALISPRRQDAGTKLWVIVSITLKCTLEKLSTRQTLRSTTKPHLGFCTAGASVVVFRFIPPVIDWWALGIFLSVAYMLRSSELVVNW